MQIRCGHHRDVALIVKYDYRFSVIIFDASREKHAMFFPGKLVGKM
jgi:hypothetical protein